MADIERLIDLLQSLEEANESDAGVREGLTNAEPAAGNPTVESPELAAELARCVEALAEVDRCFGRDAAQHEQFWPEIPGYELLDELGSGGMATVFKARQLKLNRIVALKVVAAGGIRSRRLDQRFRVEAELVARLKHPNIVQVHETGESATVHYLVLEYVNGGTLAQRLMGKPQSERWAAEAARTIALAVEHAHQQGIVHRDLKPSNILIGTGVLKVADFGLAKFLDNDLHLTRSGESLGTPSYMAPEQASGVSSARVDVYAIGAILYEMLTGRPPFTAETPAETLVQVRTARRDCSWTDPSPPCP